MRVKDSLDQFLHIPYINQGLREPAGYLHTSETDRNTMSGHCKLIQEKNGDFALGNKITRIHIIALR